MATRSARSEERVVRKMLRQVAARSSKSGEVGGSAATAAQALAHLVDAQTRMSRGDTDFSPRESPLATHAQAASVVAAPGKGLPTVVHAAKRRSGWVGPVVAVASAALLVVGASLGASAWNSRHSVSGTLMLDREPLSQVELAFQPKAGTGEPIRVVTSVNGTFSIPSLPAGDYAIFVSPSAASPKVPKRYLAPESTPFRLTLTRDRSDLRMIASSGPRK
jgi:hypothetical protein